jgi:hypothetical protein
MEVFRAFAALGLPLWIYGLVMLTRAVLIQAGRLKGALLREFQPYDEQPRRYNSLLDLTLHAGLLWGGVVLFLANYTTIASAWMLPAVMLLLLAWVAYGFQNDLQTVMPRPRWFQDVVQRTTAEERRRIAYAWLSITPNMRRHYNAHDQAFFRWVDLVLLATA